MTHLFHAGGQFVRAAADALLSGYAAASGRDAQLEAGAFATAVAGHLNFLRVMADQAIGDPARPSRCPWAAAVKVSSA
jgi:hypothetical protein